MSLSSLSKAFETLRCIAHELGNAVPSSEGNGPLNVHLATPQNTFPVLRTIMCQQLDSATKHSDFRIAADWLVNHLGDFDTQPDATQLELLHQLIGCRAPPVLSLHAAPGCGKTFFCCLLMYGLCKAEQQEGRRRLHWLTAPTKSLVTDIVSLAKQVFPLEMIAPVGIAPDGVDRHMSHCRLLEEQTFPDELATINAAVKAAKRALGRVNVMYGSIVFDSKYSEAAALLKSAILAGTDFFNSDAYADFQHKRDTDVVVVISTTSFKLKFNAGHRSAVTRIMETGVLPGGHVADEADASTLSCIVGATARDDWLLVPTDPAQHMRGVHYYNYTRASDAIMKEEDPNKWLLFGGTGNRLCMTKTRRFGTSVVNMLASVLPEAYKSLDVTEDAPTTSIRYIDLGNVHWRAVGSRAGGVFSDKVYSILLAEVKRLQGRGPLLIMTIYAVTRELLAAWLMCHGIPVTTSTSTMCPTSDQELVQVLTARQARGTTRTYAIAVFCRRQALDHYFIGSCADPGKICVMLSRMNKHLTIFSEECSRDDVLCRIRNYMWEHRRDCGHSYIPIDTYNRRPPVREVYEQGMLRADAWFEQRQWPSRLHENSDDDDPSSTFDFFCNTQNLHDATRHSSTNQRKGGDIPRLATPARVTLSVWDHVSKLVVTGYVWSRVVESQDTAAGDDGQHPYQIGQLTHDTVCNHSVVFYKL